MLKSELRLNFANLRKQLSSEEVISSSIRIGKFLPDLPIWDLHCYHIFLSILENKEVDTSTILELLRTKQKEIVVPKVEDSARLEHYLLEDDMQLVKNHWGIPEPISGTRIPVEQIDLVFVPLLAFDLKGNRVGYGKGYYDRFLESCRDDVIKIGLSLFEAVEEISDAGPEDIPLNYCITPLKVYVF